MIDKNIKFYNTYEISLGRTNHNIDMNTIKNLNKLAKIDLFFIGSILENISNWTYVFHDQSNKYKTIISKLCFEILGCFFPLIVFGAGFVSRRGFGEEFCARNIKIFHFYLLILNFAPFFCNILFLILLRHPYSLHFC